MKRFLAVILPVLLLSSCSFDSGYSEFYDKIYGVTLSYPDTWTASTDDEGLIVTLAPPEHENVGDETVTLFAECYMINNVTMTTEEYIALSEASLSYLEDYKLLSKEQKNIGDLSGYIIMYSGRDVDDPTNTTYVWSIFVTLKEGYAYVLAHTSMLDEDSTTDVFDSILASLRIEPNENYEAELKFYTEYHQKLNGRSK